MPLVAVDDIRLMVEEKGSGDPLVLVHGSWDDRNAWGLVDDELARSSRVVTYDRRGHGESDDSPGAGSRREDEDDLAGLVEALELAPAHLVANSFGASIALGLAARRPELVRSLCLHEPPLLTLAGDDPAVGQVGAVVGEALSLIDHGEHEAAARLFAERVALGPGAWEAMPSEDRATMTTHAGTFADEQRDPAWADVDLGALATLDVPVLLTQGDESPPFFSTIIALLANALEHPEVRELPGAGHIPHVTAPGEWLAVVREFGARTPRARALRRRSRVAEAGSR